MVKATPLASRRGGAASGAALHRTVALPARSPTVFEEYVYKACSLIPKGKVSTYGDLAKVLHSSPRAVGQALRRNPYAPKVPCHRVIAASLELGGFKGTWGATDQVSQKQRMLSEEGVRFSGTRLQSNACVFATEDLAHALAAASKAD